MIPAASVTAGAFRRGRPALICRRRFLAISACGMALGGPASAATAAWRGSALGATASITLGGTGQRRAEATFAAVAAELDRLEDIFSLYRANSALAKLNRTGRLAAPPADLVELLALGDNLFNATAGAFDPSVQPLWRAHAQGGDLKAAARAVGWDGVIVESGQIRFMRPGMSLTLNGVAQGFITDRIAALLRANGYHDVLVDMGEIAALGSRHGTAWHADIAAPDGRVVRRLSLRDRCLAVSAPLCTRLDPEAGIGHILDPRPGYQATATRLVAVSAKQAAVADGLSTGCALLTPKEALVAVSRFSDATIETLI